MILPTIKVERNRCMITTENGDITIKMRSNDSLANSTNQETLINQIRCEAK